MSSPSVNRHAFISIKNCNLKQATGAYFKGLPKDEDANMNCLVCRIRIIFALLLSLNFSMQSTNAQSNNKFDEAYKGFHSFYEQALRKHGIVGSSLFLVHDNQVIAKELYGTANIEKKQAV